MSESPEPLEWKLDVGVDDGGDCPVQTDFRNVLLIYEGEFESIKILPTVHLHFTPTHSSWINQVECWFSILSRGALRGASFTNVRTLVEAIKAFIARWNQTAAPFEWTKEEVHQQRLKPCLR